MKLYAVLTGDLIGSRRLAADQLEQAMGLIRGFVAEFDQIHPGSLVGGPDVFRGDSWQICLDRPALAVTAAVFIRAGLKAHAFDSRVGIGLGPVDSIHRDRISESTGPAFLRSGEALDRLGKGCALALDAAGGALGIEAAGLVAVPLLDANLTRWSQRESVAVYGTLRNLSQAAIAELPLARTKEGKSPTRQTIQDALRRIQWSSHLQPALDNLLQIIEKSLGPEQEGSGNAFTSKASL